jgi:opacity protein-like surface antigen
MKKPLLLLSAVALAALLPLPANAGETYTAPQPTAEVYGTGWYGAIQAGGNIFQDRGDVRTFTNGFGDRLTLDPTNDTGFFGGIKVGYVFGTAPIRFALEEDMFYNGWQSGADSTLTIGGVTTRSSSSWDMNSGAFMTNGLLKLSSGKFQPYIGFGIGCYYAETASASFGPFNFSGGSSHADFAWQAIAGADYYFNQRNSIFIEYKFLEYTASQADIGDSRVLGQHLLGAGWRFHF